MTTPKEVLDLLKILISPDAKQFDASVAEYERIDLSLQKNISRAQAHLKNLLLKDHNILLSFKSFSEKCYVLCSLDYAHIKANISESTNKESTDKESSNVDGDDIRGKQTLCGEADIRWNFVKCNLLVLLWLKSSIQDAMLAYNIDHKDVKLSSKSVPEHQVPPLSPDVLSFEQQTYVLTSAQFIACLGICPCFLPGVGIPIEKRSGFAQLLKGSQSQNLSRSEWDTRLWLCMKAIVECLQVSSLGSIILSRHLSDVLAGLLQLSQPIRKAQREQSLTSSQSTGVGTSQKAVSENGAPTLLVENRKGSGDQSCITLSDRKQAQEELCRLELRILQPLLVRELLLLQSGMSASPHGKQTSSGIGRPPVWLRRICGRMLSECLIRKQGLLSVLGGILDNSPVGSFSGCSKHWSLDWSKCDVAAKIIAGCPAFAVCREQYMQAMAPQILALLHSRDKLHAAGYVRVATHTISYMVQQNPELTQRFLIQPLLGPLLCGTQDLAEVAEAVVFVDEISLEQCIRDIHNLFVTCSGPGDQGILDKLVPVLHPLFRLHCFMHKGVTHQKKQVEEILTKSLQQLHITQSLAALKFFTLGEKAHGSKLQALSKRVTFVAGHEGGLVALLLPSVECTTVDDWERTASAVVDLVQKSNSQELTAQLFITCLQFLTGIVSEEVAEEAVDLGSSASASTSQEATHLEKSPSEDEEWIKLQKNLTVLNLLGKMCDVLGPDCLKNASHIVDFVEVTLERSVLVLDNTDELALGVFEGETIAMAMGLLSAVLGGEVQMTSEDYKKSQRLLPLLQRIIDSHPDTNMQQLAFDLRVSIATQGHVNVESSKSVDSKMQKMTKTKNSSSGGKDILSKTKGAKGNLLIEEISTLSEVECSSKSRVQNASVNSEQSTKYSKNTRTNISTEEDEINNLTLDTTEKIMNLKLNETSPCNMDKKETLSQALKDLQNPLLPIKGHGLISLRHLVENQDLETIQDQDMVLNIFMENVKHTDSYIYLGAIQGLAALAFADPGKILAVLMEEFTAQGKERDGSGSLAGKATSIKTFRSTEVRLKIGEVLVKTSKTLGEMAPVYRNLLLNGFLSGTKDLDHHIRASSLSNMGDICKHLQFSLGAIIYEVLECVGAIVKSDPEIIVKRAAAMFITNLLQGLGNEALQVLDRAIRDLYRLLKLVLKAEKDDVVELHVQMALEELDRIMKEFIFPKQTFEKKIHVLSAPPEY